MLLDTIAAGAPMLGGAGGGLLGQMGDILSMPRRSLMHLLGMPDTGTELLHQTFGMDPDSLLTKGLGVGAEMALDPLTYAGIPLGGALGKVAGHLSGGEAAIAREIEALQALEQPAGKAAASYGADRLAADASMRDTAAQTVANRAEEVGGLDVKGIADAKMKEYKRASPQARQALEEAGMGVDPTGLQDGHLPVSVHGTTNPPGTELRPYHNGPPGNRSLAGRALELDRPRYGVMGVDVNNPNGDLFATGDHLPLDEFRTDANLPAYAQLHPNWDDMLEPQAIPQLSPYERYRLMSDTANAGGTKGMDTGALVNQVMQDVHGNATPAIDSYHRDFPEPSLRTALEVHGADPSVFSQLDHLGADASPLLGGLPIRDAHQEIQSLLARALARHQAMQLHFGDHLALAGGAGGAIGAGYALGQG